MAKERTGHLAGLNTYLSEKVRQCSFAVVSEVRAPSSRGALARYEPLHEALRTAGDFITALRLLKEGDVYAFFSLGFNPESDEMVELGDQRKLWGAGERQYELASRDQPLLGELLQKLPPALQSRRDIRLATDRFAWAYGRRSPEDRLIDYWIALEALFLPGSMTELRFRGALRVACYVGRTPVHRSLVYDLMKRSYDSRSKVVHGERMDPELLDRTAMETEEIVRIALRQAVRYPWSLDVQQLDRWALLGEDAYIVEGQP